MITQHNSPMQKFSSTKLPIRPRAISLMLSLFCTMTAVPSAFASEADHHFEQAMKYEFAGNIEGAIAEYRRGLQSAPQSVDGHTRLGTLLLDEEGDVDGAISEFVTAMTIDPQCKSCQARLDEAVDRKNASAKDGINRGNDFYRAGKLARSAAAYRLAVSADPKDAEARNSLAWTLYRLGKLEEGLAEVNEALRLKPDEAEYINTLACLQYDMGDVDQAISTWKKAIAKSKSPNPADLYGLAVGFLSKGDTANAVKNFKEALKSDSNYASASYLRDKIGMSINALATHDRLLTVSGEKEQSAEKKEEGEKKESAGTK
jgi:tetratricopeptide (TPR) repeat protein